MALVLAENKELQAMVKDLEARLSRTRYREEDLKVKVKALEKEHQLLEAKNQSLTEWCSHHNDQQKGKTSCAHPVSVRYHYLLMHSYVELETELGLSREAVAQL